MPPTPTPNNDPRLELTPPPEPSATQDLRPDVAQVGAGQSPWLIIGGAVLLGLIVFLWISSHRPKPAPSLIAANPSAATDLPAPPQTPPDIAAMQTAARQPQAPPQAAPPPLPQSAPTTAPVTILASPPAPAQTSHAPVLVVDLAQPAAATPQPASSDAAKTASPAGNLNSDEQFAARLASAAEPARTHATALKNKSAVVAEGAMIPAVLETALDSDLPGYARAVVSRDVLSFDGRAVLIPRGSRVVGEYRSAAAQGQSRAFVIWTRVLRPDGVSVQIGSPATDPLGRAGLSGTVDSHFFERFSGAILLSIVNAGATALAGSPSTEVVIGSSAASSGVAGAASAYAPANISPTIKVPQGAPIRIFVAHDLDFSGVADAGAHP
jgi:type IV secretion system protein VirB10